MPDYGDGAALKRSLVMARMLVSRVVTEQHASVSK